MIIIIGLGNPGKKFEGTRHNVGFMALDKFAKENNFPEFSLEKKYEALVCEDLIAGEKIILAKPETFMNESGKTARLLTENNKGEIIVVHDDIDLPVGKIKIIKERGSAGHKGVQSIIKAVGNDGLIRFRIGIAGQNDAKAMAVVLKKFTKDEQIILEKTIEKTAEAISFFVKEGLEKTMNEYNK